MKKQCVSCDKGSAVMTCDGCQRSFCLKHIVEHRQQLAIEMDTIGQEHDIFRRDLMEDTVVHPLRQRIDAWEQDSITKIQVAADAARADLRQLLEQRKTALHSSMESIASQIQSCRELDDYTENDLANFTAQLKELRQKLLSELVADIIEDPEACTRMIKLREPQPPPLESRPLQASPDDANARHGVLLMGHERFSKFFGKVFIQADGLQTTCTGTYWNGSSVYGDGQYAAGMHHIRFSVEQKGGHNLFFGITSAAYDMPWVMSTSPYTVGWWELEDPIDMAVEFRTPNGRCIRTGDEVTVTLDCDTRQVRLEHHRSRITNHAPVDLDKCPFPWKIVVTLRSQGDCIRILP